MANNNYPDCLYPALFIRHVVNDSNGDDGLKTVRPVGQTERVRNQALKATLSANGNQLRTPVSSVRVCSTRAIINEESFPLLTTISLACHAPIGTDGIAQRIHVQVFAIPAADVGQQRSLRQRS